MTAPNVTIANIIIGACTSFTVDSNQLGGTSGGVTMEKKRTFTDLQVDQVTGVVKKAIKEETYTIKTNLSEATLANLQLAWGLSQAPVTATTPATETLNIGLETTVTEHTLAFVGPSPSGTYTSRTFSVNRAISMAVAKPIMAKDKETLFEVEFECLPDLTKTGSEYGTVVDQ